MKAHAQLRTIAFLEGLSLGVLVFVAMPLKYLAHLPLAVRIVGSIHGLLFVMFLAMLYRVALEDGWPARRSLGAVGWSLVPFGGMFFAKKIPAVGPTDR